METCFDVNAFRCEAFGKGCSGCRIQNLSIGRQLEAKRQLIIDMLWKAYRLDKKERQVRVDFFRDVYRLQIMSSYAPQNVHQINARYEYDVEKYKDRVFLENVQMTFSEAEKLVSPVVANPDEIYK